MQVSYQYFFPAGGKIIRHYFAFRRKSIGIGDESETKFPDDRAQRARRGADKEIFQIKLSELCKMMKVHQDEIKMFQKHAGNKSDVLIDTSVQPLLKDPIMKWCNAIEK